MLREDTDDKIEELKKRVIHMDNRQHTYFGIVDDHSKEIKELKSKLIEHAEANRRQISENFELLTNKINASHALTLSTIDKRMTVEVEQKDGKIETKDLKAFTISKFDSIEPRFFNLFKGDFDKFRIALEEFEMK